MTCRSTFSSWTNVSTVHKGHLAQPDFRVDQDREECAADEDNQECLVEMGSQDSRAALDLRESLVQLGQLENQAFLVKIRRLSTDDPV